MSLIDLVLAILGTYRAAAMISREDGPFDAFARVRDLSLQHDERGGKETWLTRGLNCPLCVSFWTALVFARLAGRADLLTWFGIAGAAMILFKYEGRGL